jgi:hypothetical protein
VAVGEKKPPALVNDQRVVAHTGEVEQELVNLRVAVSPHGNDSLAVLVEDVNDTVRVVSAGETVARAVIENIAQNAEKRGV